MNTRSLIWTGMIVGTTVGSFLPSLWGANYFSMTSVWLSAALGVAGMWVGYKISRM